MPRQNANNPGLFVTYRDGNLVVPITTQSTGNITIIDFALWGPVNQPYTFSTLEAGQAIFGKTNGAYGDINRVTGYNGNAAMKAAAEALQAGNRNVTVVRPDFGGEQAKTSLFYAIAEDLGARVSDAGDAVNGATLTLTSASSEKKTAVLANLKVGNACWKSGSGDDTTIKYKVSSINKTLETITLEGNEETLALDVTTASSVTLGANNGALTLTAGSSYLGVDGDALRVVVVAADTEANASVSFTAPTLTISLGTSAPTNTALALATLITNDISDTDVTAAHGGTGGTAVAAATSTAFTGGVGPTFDWAFGVGFSIAGSYPGAVGNTIKYKIDSTDSNATVNLKLKFPKEFGGYGASYNSLYNATLGSLAARINRDFANIVSVTLDYATGLESFGYAATNLINGTLINAGDTAIVTTEDVEGVADITNPTKDGYYRIGQTIGTHSGVSSIVIVGLDAEETANGLRNPSLGNISSELKSMWYAQALGNVNDEADSEKTLPLLVGQPIGVVVIDGLTIDNMVTSAGVVKNLSAAKNYTGTLLPNNNALQYLVDFCHQQNNEGFATEAVIGCTPLRSTKLADINNRATFLRSIGFMDGTLANTDDNSEIVDAGRYLSVVAGPQVVVNNREIGSYASSGAIQYAALLTTTPVSNPPSQKQIGGVLGTAFTFPKSTMSNLSGGQGNTRSGGAYVVLDNYGGQTITNLAVTAAARTSDYAKIHNRRVVTAAGAAVRSAVRPFLGNAFGVEQYNAMYTSIQSALDTLVDAGVIYGGKGVGYDFMITQTDAEAILSVANVSLSIRPNFELDWVNVDVKLKV